MEDDKIYKDFFEIIYPIIKDKPFKLKPDDSGFNYDNDMEFYVGKKIDEHSVYVYWYEYMEERETIYDNQRVGELFYEGIWFLKDLNTGDGETMREWVNINKINTEEIFNLINSELG